MLERTMSMQPTFDERREARRNLSSLRGDASLERWQGMARQARRRHSQWRVNPFVSFTAREAAIQELSAQLMRDEVVRASVAPGVNWVAMAEAVLASTPRDPGVLHVVGDAVWRVVGWGFMALTSRARQAEARSICLSVSTKPGGPTPHGMAA